jgi:aminomethyltransferase
MVEFGGYDMPLQYSGIRDEHLAVRERAGVFDVSHMGEVLIHGDASEAAVQQLVTNDVRVLEPNASLYTVMCTDDGGIVDDLIVVEGADSAHFILTVNAATRHQDIAFMRSVLGDSAPLRDISDELALLAVQGPRAVDVLSGITVCDGGAPLAELLPFHVTGAQVAGISDSRVSVVSRTGYTGEDGFEIYIDSGHAERLWDALLEAGKPHGLLPCGLGARDTLRLEAGLRLSGQDFDETVDPYSAGLGWTVKLDKGDFSGAAALRRIRQAGPPQTTVGLLLSGRDIARHGHAVFREEERIGEVRSGTFSFTLGRGIALALVDREAVAGAETLTVDIRGAKAPATVTKLPFYKRQQQ